MNRQDARMRKPFERIRKPSDKALNTSHVRVKHGTKYKKGDGQLKNSINYRRINKEVLRHKIAVASFIPCAFLIKHSEEFGRVCVKAVALPKALPQSNIVWGT